MGYQVPDDETVLEAAEEVLERHGVVETQRALANLVRVELQREQADYAVSELRVRRLVLEHKLAELTVVTGTTRDPPPEACPVCGNELVASRNRTLTGEETVVGTRCPRCPYTSGVTREVPLRYAFRRAGSLPGDEPVTGPF